MCLWVSSPLLIRTLVIVNEGPTLLQYDLSLHLNYIPKDSSNMSHSQGLGVGTSTSFSGDTIQPTTEGKYSEGLKICENGQVGLIIDKGTQ